MPQNSMEGQHLQDKPSWAGLGPSIPARRRLGEEIGSKHDHWLIAMRQDWRLPPLLVCIKTSGSGSGEFSGGFSGEFSGGFKGEFSGEFSGGFAGGFSGLPSSSGVPPHQKFFLWTFCICNRQHTWIHFQIRFEFSEQDWPPSSKILTLHLVHKDLTDSWIPASSLTHPIEKDGFSELLISIGDDQLNAEKRIYLILPFSIWVVGVNILALFAKGGLKIQSPSACGQIYLNYLIILIILS